MEPSTCGWYISHSIWDHFSSKLKHDYNFHVVHFPSRLIQDCTLNMCLSPLKVDTRLHPQYVFISPQGWYKIAPSICVYLPSRLIQDCTLNMCLSPLKVDTRLYPPYVSISPQGWYKIAPSICVYLPSRLIQDCTLNMCLSPLKVETLHPQHVSMSLSMLRQHCTLYLSSRRYWTLNELLSTSPLEYWFCQIHWIRWISIIFREKLHYYIISLYQYHSFPDGLIEAIKNIITHINVPIHEIIFTKCYNIMFCKWYLLVLSPVSWMASEHVYTLLLMVT